MNHTESSRQGPAGDNTGCRTGTLRPSGPVACLPDVLPFPSSVIKAGNLTDDPEVRYTAVGAPSSPDVWSPPARACSRRVAS